MIQKNAAFPITGLLVILSIAKLTLSKTGNESDTRMKPLCSSNGEYHRNQENCNSFYQCSNDIPYLMHCPATLHWNQQAKTCDYPKNAHCEVSTPPPKCKESEFAPDTESCNSYLVCSNSEFIIMHCPANLHWNQKTKTCDYPQNVHCEVSTPPKCNEGDYLSDNESCSNYYQCSNGVPVLMKCPSTLHWNQKTKTCDYPQNVHCEVSTPPKCNEGDYLRDNESCSNYYQCANSVPVLMKCPSTLHWSQKTKTCDYPQNVHCEVSTPPKCNEGDYLLDNESCSNYYQCSNGVPVLMKCPSTLYWNQKTKTCDFPQNVDCQHHENSTQQGKCNEGEYISDSKSCNHFYQCSNGDLYLMPCPTELYWNQNLKVCDYPWNVDCNIQISPPANKTICHEDDEYIRDDDDCGRFYHCAHNTLYEKHCGPGLCFNTRYNVCDFLENCDCDGGPHEQPPDNVIEGSGE